MICNQDISNDVLIVSANIIRINKLKLIFILNGLNIICFFEMITDII